jgi:hypothetical protein
MPARGEILEDVELPGRMRRVSAWDVVQIVFYAFAVPYGCYLVVTRFDHHRYWFSGAASAALITLGLALALVRQCRRVRIKLTAPPQSS